MSSSNVFATAFLIGKLQPNREGQTPIRRAVIWILTIHVFCIRIHEITRIHILLLNECVYPTLNISDVISSSPSFSPVPLLSWTYRLRTGHKTNTTRLALPHNELLVQNLCAGLVDTDTLSQEDGIVRPLDDSCADGQLSISRLAGLRLQVGMRKSW